MIDNLLGGGDDGDSGDGSADTDMDGGLFDGTEAGDDLTGGDDLMGGGNDMAFDDMDDDGGTTSAEMDNRIDELENEVTSLSSTVNTVKSENELISESVDDVEENIRKLLEVYEMVTRGVNPFVDESEMGNAFGSEGGAGGGNSMGLFGGDEEDESEDSGVDDSIADTDADEFFDDDLDDEIEDDEDGFGDFEEDDEDKFDEGVDEFDESDVDDGGGKSFEELKAEYDSGDADWDEDGGSSDDDTEDGGDGFADDGDEGAFEPSESDGSENTDAVEADGEPDDAETADRSEATEPAEDGKPYLETLPAGYVAEIVVMDWLEYLVEEAGIDGAARTIAYYEAIEWVDESAADALLTFLNGFGGDIEADPNPQSPLTVSHHNASLRFISRIVHPDLEAVASGGESVPRGALSEEAYATVGERGKRGSNDRPRTVRSPGETVGDPSRERHGIEPDGGRERSGIEEFYWGEDRTD